MRKKRPHFVAGFVGRRLGCGHSLQQFFDKERSLEVKVWMMMMMMMMMMMLP